MLLATTLLRQAYAPKPLRDAHGEIVPSLLDLEQKIRVLELGAGTGILPCTTGHALTNLDTTWQATDQGDLLTLLQKNVRQLASDRVVATEIDWLTVSRALRQAYRHPTPYASLLRNIRSEQSGNAGESDVPYDLIIAVDCIFNPSLFTPFLDSLWACCTVSHTIAFVLVELREQEMMREFMQTWLEHTASLQGTASGSVWQIWSIESSALGLDGLQRGYACFVAFKVNVTPV